MTRQQLNRDVKRLAYRYCKSKDTLRPDDKKEIEAEFKRLYRADQNATELTQVSLRQMIYLNRELRIFSLQEFFKNINF